MHSESAQYKLVARSRVCVRVFIVLSLINKAAVSNRTFREFLHRKAIYIYISILCIATLSNDIGIDSAARLVMGINPELSRGVSSSIGFSRGGSSMLVCIYMVGKAGAIDCEQGDFSYILYNSGELMMF